MADHLIASRSDSHGYNGSNYAVVIYDLATSVRDCFHIGDQGAVGTRRDLLLFIGPRVRVQSLHCDGATEL